MAALELQDWTNTDEVARTDTARLHSQPVCITVMTVLEMGVHVSKG